MKSRGADEFARNFDAGIPSFLAQVTVSIELRPDPRVAVSLSGKGDSGLGFLNHRLPHPHPVHLQRLDPRRLLPWRQRLLHLTRYWLRGTGVRRKRLRYGPVRIVVEVSGSEVRLARY